MCGTVHVGDEIVAVDGQPVTGHSLAGAFFRFFETSIVFRFGFAHLHGFAAIFLPSLMNTGHLTE